MSGQAFVTVDQYGAIGDGAAHSVSAWLSGGSHDRGYGDLASIQADYPHVTSLGDSADWAAVQAAFDAVGDRGEVQFTSGATYVFDNVVEVYDKSLSVQMDGATVRMDDDSVYNAFRIGVETKTSIDYVEWHGGTIDGNKDAQDWPGADRVDSAFTPLDEGGTAAETKAAWDANQVFGNNGLLGIQSAQSVVVDGITIANPVSDGVVLTNVEDGTISNSEAFGGAPLFFGTTESDYGHGVQATYFKARQSETDDFDGGTFTVEHTTTTGGSIGVHFSTPGSVPSAPPDSHLIVRDVTVSNATQNGLHAEHVLRIDIENSRFVQDDDSAFNTDVFIGNRTQFAEIRGVLVDGERITFNEGSDLVLGRVINSVVLNTNQGDFAIENATHVIGTYVESDGDGINADVVHDSQIMKWSDRGVVGANEITGSTIDNALNGGSGNAVHDFKGGVITDTVIGHAELGLIARSGQIKLVNSTISDTARNAIAVSKPLSLVLIDTTLQNYGLDPNFPESERAAIGSRSSKATVGLIQLIGTTAFVTDDPAAAGNLPIFAFPKLGVVEDQAGALSGQSGDGTQSSWSTLYGHKLSDRIEGSDGANVAYGGTGHDLLLGRDSGDVIYGGGGSDTVEGGRGDDALHGIDGADVLNGGSGDDSLVGGSGHDTLDGGSGDDVLFGGDGIDRLSGGEGLDTMFGAADDDVLSGGDGGDIVSGGEGDDLLDGGAGGDLLKGESGADSLMGGGDDDTLDGGSGDDVLNGGDGQDRLDGGGGLDLLIGDSGDDILLGAGGLDDLFGGQGTDQLFGGEGDDRLKGGSGDDALYGEAGADSLKGGSGADSLLGGEGDDTLDGGNGDDLLIGGSGSDRFSFSAKIGNDTITDFLDGSDLLVFDESATGLSDLSDLSVAGNADGHAVVSGTTSAGAFSILVTGVSGAELTSEDIIFV